MTVFVDSSALYALLDADDANNGRATRSFTSLLGTDRLTTHSYVCLETTALLQRRIGLAAVRALVDDVLPALSVEWVDEQLHRAATSACLAAGHRDVSLVDWTSFELMRRRGITTALAYDDDFTLQGFALVS